MAGLTGCAAGGTKQASSAPSAAGAQSSDSAAASEGADLEPSGLFPGYLPERLSGSLRAWLAAEGARLDDTASCAARLQSPTSSTLELLACAEVFLKDADYQFGAGSPELAEALVYLQAIETRNSVLPLAKRKGRAPTEIEWQYDLARFENARVLLALGEPAPAEARLTELAELYPQDAEVQGALGVSYLAMGFIQRSLQPLARARDLDPKRSSRFATLGTAYFLAGRTEDAIAAYRQALQLDASATQLKADLGVALLVAGQLEEGLAFLEQAVQNDPENGVLRSNYAYALYVKGELPKALEEAKHAARLVPQEVSAWLNQVTILVAQKEYDQAEIALKQAQEIAPDDPRVEKAFADLKELRAALQGAPAAP